MAFKMNKSGFNFGLGAIGKLIKGNRENNLAEGNVVTDPQTQDAQDPNLEANKAMKLATGQTSTSDEKMNAISKIINS
tara:strand:- start:254 stop:487 length:234 start_codon:yes stop_codon:yes gene_type:complete